MLAARQAASAVINAVKLEANNSPAILILSSNETLTTQATHSLLHIFKASLENPNIAWIKAQKN